MASAGTAAALVEVWRGPIVESRHCGHLAVVAGDGKTIAELGSPDTVSYLRSSCKPFQALPLVASGAADRFGFTTQEVAIACGSHCGEPVHVETVRSMLQKTGLGAGALKCGVHVPFNAEAARALAQVGEAPSVSQNNCSGKHAGMLALALHLGAPTETYNQATNPVQQEITRTISEFANVPLNEIAIGTDGCGVPVFGVPVRAMSLMYARLVSPPQGFNSKIREACRRVVAAMIEFPEMVGGTVGRIDTELIRLSAGRLVSKVGAEGVYTVGVLPCDAWPAGLGVALKIEDGDNQRARPPVMIEALRQLGVLDGQALATLAPYFRPAIKNHRGDRVGEVRAYFDLTML